MDLKFTILNGTGNRFAVTNYMGADQAKSLNEHFEVSSLRVLAQKMCSMFEVDGFIILTEPKDKNSDYSWLFFNADGSEAEMCGNAARCVGSLAFKNHIAEEEHTFDSIAGPISVYVLIEEDAVKVEMTPLEVLNLKQTFSEEYSPLNRPFLYHSVNTGVPHCVIQLEEFSQHQAWKESARKIRHLTDVFPKGTNVTFYQALNADEILAVSYERGVEDYTLACGTGAVAAAYCHNLTSSAGLIKVQMPGGRVSVDLSGNRPYLTGPVAYESTLFNEDIKELWMNSYTD